MPTYRKIPGTKQGQATAIGSYAVFCTGILKAANVIKKLEASDKKSPIPAHGYLNYKGEKIYYCRYGLVGDREIYTNRAPRKQSRK